MSGIHVLLEETGGGIPREDGVLDVELQGVMGGDVFF